MSREGKESEDDSTALLALLLRLTWYYIVESPNVGPSKEAKMSTY